MGGGGTGVLAKWSVMEAEDEEESNGLDGRERIGGCCRSRVHCSLGEGFEALGRYTLYSLSAGYWSGKPTYPPPATAKNNKAQPSKLYDLIIAANGLLQVVRSILRRRAIEQLRPNPNSSARILLMITMGAPMGSEAMSHAYSAVMEDCIKDDGGAFQSLPTTNSGSSAKLPIEKGPGAIISQRTSHEGCPMISSDPTDGTQRKDYCRFSQ
ncbi:hypothetical protein HOY82DRAFT_539165 [Tuber indicum]|nr:hypothetical protein HOY82DRAFT_539165 [Tuber indicum]